MPLLPLLLSQVLPFEAQYLEALPCAQMYERSYMHRDTVTHVVVRCAAHRTASLQSADAPCCVCRQQ
jgi:hypothetical protein